MVTYGGRAWIEEVMISRKDKAAISTFFSICSALSRLALAGSNGALLPNTSSEHRVEGLQRCNNKEALPGTSDIYEYFGKVNTNALSRRITRD